MSKEGRMRLAHGRRGTTPFTATTEFARQREGGYVLVKFALLLIPLLLISGLSIDVGYWYSRVSDIQKAADAAALAGVVWLPNEDLAEQYALEAAAENGFAPDTNTTVDVTPVEGDNPRLKVTIEKRRVGSFLWANLGGRQITLNRSALAEYVLPVKMGSPERFLGNDPTVSGYPSGAPNLWASISGPNTDYRNGDPYSTKLGSEYRDWGYLYVVDVPESQVGRTIRVEIYDAGHYARNNYPNEETADFGSVNTQFELFQPDATPLDTFDGLTDANSFQGSGRCTTGTGRIRLATNTSSGTYRNRWATLCRFTATAAGRHILQVKSSAIPTIADGGNGWNQFSIRTSSSGTEQPSLYTVGDLSLFNNLPGRSGTINASFYLAEIEQKHAGKTLEVSLFDPGDGQSGTYYANIRGPNNTTQSCRYKERSSSTWVTSANCRIQTRTSTGSNVFNGKWLDIQVFVPTAYVCTDCWWKVLYEFQNVSSGASPNDRTVWSARVVGDPVHLVEEEAS